MLDIGRRHFAHQDVRTALGILADSPGVMERQPLTRGDNPLADMDYHAIAHAEQAPGRGRDQRPVAVWAAPESGPAPTKAWALALGQWGRLVR